MYKKILFCFVLLISFIPITYAQDEYSCFYDFSYKTGAFNWFEKNDDLEFKINIKTNTITYPQKMIHLDENVYFMDYYVDSKFTEEYIIESLNGGCPPKIVIGALGFEDVFGYGIFFEESHFYSLKEVPAGFALPEKFFEDYEVLGAIVEHSIGTLNEEKSTGESKEAGFGCDYYDKTIKRLKELNCNKDKSSCDLSQIDEFNKDLNNIKSFCSTVTKYANYGISYCLSACLSLSSEPIFETLNTNLTCGFSEKLIIYIANIVKWIKYIIPVIVIVLGILDFIKAIASEKDDEMKKAQGSFVKRLIAAALIFIIPFIIEFILDKMGFATNGCGIIDL